MVLPSTIAQASPLDPLVLLPLPDTLPPSPAAELAPLVSALKAHLENQPNAIPLPALAAGMRTATRNAQVLVNSARLGAAEARLKLDQEDVALRTTEYELARVREQMAQCNAYEWVTRVLSNPRPMYETMTMPDAESLEAEVLSAIREYPRSR